MWKLVYWLWRYKLNEVCDNVANMYSSLITFTWYRLLENTYLIAVQSSLNLAITLFIPKCMSSPKVYIFGMDIRLECVIFQSDYICSNLQIISFSSYLLSDFFQCRSLIFILLQIFLLNFYKLYRSLFLASNNHLTVSIPK